MPKDVMTPRERLQAVLSRRQPDRVPLHYRATPEATENLLRHLGCSYEQMLQRLHIDQPVTVEPRYVGPVLPEHTDAYRVRYQDIDYGTGVYREAVGHPLAQFRSVEEIERSYTWPRPDWWDYAGIRDQANGNDHLPIRGGGSEPFLVYCYLRGQEQAFVDLALHPEIVHYCLGKLFDLAYESTRRIYEQIPGKVMLTTVAEDMGSQEGLIFSPAHVREFLLPGMKRMIDLAHEAGAFVLHHNDGSCRRMLPDLIALGIDMLDPVQWRCKGMEREALKRDFGDSIVFHGAMDNQYTLPFGKVEEVRQEVLDNLHILGQGGGYVLAPCHAMQSLTPPPNVVAMYETGYHYGWM